MLLVYVDTGGWHPMVGSLEKDGRLTTCYFPFEQRNKRVKSFVAGSASTWKQSNLTWKEDVGTYQDDEPSELFLRVLQIVGGNRVDAQHLDSAYKAGCSVFLTSDRTDIWSNRTNLQDLLKMQVLHIPSEIELLKRIAQGSI